MEAKRFTLQDLRSAFIAGETFESEVISVDMDELNEINAPDFGEWVKDNFGIDVDTPFKLGDNLDGGIVVYVDESGKHGLIAAVADFGYKNWNEANRLCKGYRGGGFDDWRLPTKDELNLLYRAYKMDIGGFVAITYWSSSEYSATSAWYQSFNNGGQDNGDKNDDGCVRAVRSF